MESFLNFEWRCIILDEIYDPKSYKKYIKFKKIILNGLERILNYVKWNATEYKSVNKTE